MPASESPPVPLSWDLAFWRKQEGSQAGNLAAGARQSKLELFEEIMLPHLDSAHNLARWLIRNEEDARDAVQESYLRAFQFFEGYKGGDGKSWILAIVRNTCRSWHRRRQRESESVSFDEAAHSASQNVVYQEHRVTEREKSGILRNCIERLPADYREVLILRELEEMSYREIAEVTGLAMGTVMSRLSRARKRLEECAAGRVAEAAG